MTAPLPPSGYSDYIVFVDESGDHALDKINAEYPVFVLAFCLFKKEAYAQRVCPDVQALKFKYFGHDTVILHEREIRKAKPPFAMLQVPETRASFLGDVGALVESLPMTVIAIVIRKDALNDRYNYPGNPYFLALEFGLERIATELETRNEVLRTTHIVFECRGAKEDADLELAFRRVMDTNPACSSQRFEILMCDKRANLAGLQLADLIARPIGQHVIHPEKASRAFDAVYPKLRRLGPGGSPYRYGLKIFP